MTKIELNVPDLNVPPETLKFMQRVLGPVAEASDFLADKIRFYRWKSSLAMIRDAEAIARMNNLDISEVPLKTLVPLLEKSSLEAEDSDLVNRWANLLVSAANHNTEEQNTFIDILGRLSSNQVVFLENYLPKSYFDDFDITGADDLNPSTKMFVNIQYEVSHLLRSTIDECCSVNLAKLDTETAQKHVFRLAYKDDPVRATSVRCHFLDGRDLPNEILAANIEMFENNTSVEVLNSAGLLSRRTIEYRDADSLISVEVSYPTVLGLNFVAACRGDSFQ